MFETSWHVSVAAESMTALLFARAGFDVSVRYGANNVVSLSCWMIH
jgi:hypothetical protein